MVDSPDALERFDTWLGADRYRGRRGERINFYQYLKVCGTEKYMRVASTRFNHVWISTVFLGIVIMDSPYIFETMVFYHDETLGSMRYRTESEAKAGHRQFVKIVRNIRKPNLKFARESRIRRTMRRRK